MNKKSGAFYESISNNKIHQRSSKEHILYHLERYDLKFASNKSFTSSRKNGLQTFQPKNQATLIFFREKSSLFNLS